jgi:3-deoxy-D-arabino-heptulosonate 7-phosphate (DAHP) synthase
VRASALGERWGAFLLQRTDDLRITQVRPLIPPAILIEEIPLSEQASNVVSPAATHASS